MDNPVRYVMNCCKLLIETLVFYSEFDTKSWCFLFVKYENIFHEIDRRFQVMSIQFPFFFGMAILGFTFMRKIECHA